ncbi:MAG TPA: phBC6A51 family helix-turn-helix protein [Candidatus Woesebacteria bacterium]|nr:phBC6A51 family helix-turn-helix protein [Candidatus Woesebacteria bacterium]
MNTIEKRQEENKSKLIELLQKTPIVQVVCEKSGVSRATYYRWRSEDKKFKEESDKALKEGIEMINDMAESQLLSSIRDKNMTAIIFWLKNHHQSYIPKLEISSDQNHLRDDLTPDEEAIVREALLLSGVIKEKPIKENGKAETF